MALWCCFQKTGDLFDTPIPTPAAITRAATQVIHHARPIPSHGLNVQQICNAINHVGLEPEVIHVNENVPLASLIHGYLKMGLPVVLGVSIEGRGRHAITLTGYSLQKTTALKQEVAGNKTCIPMIGLRIDEFYAHDDQIGPFSRLRVNPTALYEKKAYPVTFESAWHDHSTGKNLRFYPDVVVVPVYGKIRVTFIDIQKWLTRLTEVLYLVFPPGVSLEWDIYLTTTNDYKRYLKNSGIATGREEVLESLLLQQHPRFIWRSTLRHNGIEILELLADATDMSRSLPIYHVLWHNDIVKSSFNQRLEAPSLRDLFIEILTQRFWTLLRDSTKPSD